MIKRWKEKQEYKSISSARRLYAIAALSLCATILFSCASMKLTRKQGESQTSWKMFGEDASHHSSGKISSTGIEEIWEQDVSAGLGNFSPTINGGVVYVGTLKGEIHALDIANGKELASRNFGGAIFSGPVISDSLLIVASSQSKENLFVYDIYAGDILWSKEIADVEASPTFYKGGIYVATIEGDLCKFDLLTGKEIFHRRFEAPTRSCPAVDDSLCVLGCDDGKVYAVGADGGKEKWKFESGSPVWCSPSMNDSSIFIGTNAGRLLALDRRGKLEFDFLTGEKILSMPISDDRRVYFGCDDGNYYALDIHTGALLWKVHTDAPIIAAGSQTKTQIFFGGYDKTVYVVDKMDGKVEQRINLSGRIRTQPAMFEDLLVIGAEDSNVYGFKIK